MVPSTRLPYTRLVAESETVVGASPVPVSLMVCCEVAALSIMVMTAVRGPADAGAKCPWMEQFAPATRLVPQLVANMNEEAPVPVKLMLEKLSVVAPVLVRVTLCDPLVVPSTMLP